MGAGTAAADGPQLACIPDGYPRGTNRRANRQRPGNPGGKVDTLGVQGHGYSSHRLDRGLCDGDRPAERTRDPGPGLVGLYHRAASQGRVGLDRVPRGVCAHRFDPGVRIQGSDPLLGNLERGGYWLQSRQLGWGHLHEPAGLCLFAGRRSHGIAQRLSLGGYGRHPGNQERGSGRKRAAGRAVQCLESG